MLIVEGAREEKEEYTLEMAVTLARKFVAEGSSTSAAAKEAAEITGIKKGDIYKEILKEE